MIFRISIGCNNFQFIFINRIFKFTINFRIVKQIIKATFLFFLKKINKRCRFYRYNVKLLLIRVFNKTRTIFDRRFNLTITIIINSTIITNLSIITNSIVFFYINPKNYRTKLLTIEIFIFNEFIKSRLTNSKNSSNINFNKISTISTIFMIIIIKKFKILFQTRIRKIILIIIIQKTRIRKSILSIYFHRNIYVIVVRRFSNPGTNCSVILNNNIGTRNPFLKKPCLIF